MRVIDLIKSTDKTAFSFEIPLLSKGQALKKFMQILTYCVNFDPKYINITTHRSEYVYRELGDGRFRRDRLRRRPGSVAVELAI